MAFRLNLLLAWLTGWIVSVLLASLILVTFSGVYSANAIAVFLAFMLAVLLPACGCYYAGLRNRNSLLRILISSSAGWLIAMVCRPQISAHRNTWAEWIADSPFTRHEWTIACFCLSAVFAICVIILDPRTKHSTMANRGG